MKKINLVLTAILITLFLTSCTSRAIVSTSSNMVQVSGTGEESTTEFDTKPEEVDSKNLSMIINYGYEKYAKYGKNMQVTVDITNTGGDFLGKLQVIAPNESLGNIMYEKEVAVAADSSKKVTIAIPLNSYSTKFKFKLVTEQNKTVLERTSKANITTDYNLIFTGILSDDYNSLSYINSDIIKTFNLSEETLSEDVLGLDLLDIIIINDFSTSKLNENQYSAIKAWVNNGGTLVIGTGGSHQKTLEIFSDDFLTGKIGDVSSVNLNLFDSQRSDTDIMKKEILDISIDNATTVFENEYPLIKQVKSGRGVINVVTFDMGLNNTQWSMEGSIIRLNIQEGMSDYQKSQLMFGPRYNSNSNWSLYNALSGINNGELPNIWTFAIILGIYTLFVGPILYIILKKIDKRNFMWVAVPIFALVFSGVILLIGNKTRFTQPFIKYLAVTTIDGNIASEEINFAVTTPNNKKYSMEFDNKNGIQVLNANAYYYGGNQEVSVEEYKIAIKYKADTTTVELGEVSAFSSNYFRASDYYETDGLLQPDIAYTRDGISGTITNSLGYDLENAILLSKGMLINLETIKNGETITIKDNYKAEMLNFDYNSIIGDILGTNYPDNNISTEELNYARQKESALTYLVQRYIEEESEEAYVVGFSSNTDNLSIAKNVTYESYGIRLIKAPVNVNYQKDNLIYLPNLSIYLTNNVQGFDKNYGYMYDETAMAEYDFGTYENILEIYYEPNKNITSQINYNYSDFYGEIEFFNYETNDYETVFKAESKITDLDKYLGDNNILKTRFSRTPNSSSYNYNMKLPVLSATKEAK